MEARQAAKILYEDDSSKDYIIYIKDTDRSYKAHKSLLFHYCAYFRGNSSLAKLSETSEYEAIITEVEETWLRMILEFIYGQLTFNVDHINALFVAADFFQIDQLFLWLFQNLRNETLTELDASFMLALLDRFVRIAYEYRYDEGFSRCRPTQFLFWICDRIISNIHSVGKSVVSNTNYGLDTMRSTWLLTIVLGVVDEIGYDPKEHELTPTSSSMELWKYLPPSYDLQSIDRQRHTLHEMASDTAVQEARYALCDAWNKSEAEVKAGTCTKQSQWYNFKPEGGFEEIAKHYIRAMGSLPLPVKCSKKYLMELDRFANTLPATNIKKTIIEKRRLETIHVEAKKSKRSEEPNLSTAFLLSDDYDENDDDDEEMM